MKESLFIPYTATTDLPKGNVLVLAPHPDDEVFGCAGAIMQHVSQNDSVQVVIITDGSAAITHPNTDSRIKYIETRQQESIKVAQVLGYGSPEFWGIADRALKCNDNFIEQLVNYIKEKQISLVYAPSVMEIHPDHYALAMSAVEAVRRCGESVSLSMYEIGIPLHPNVLLDITHMLERKKEAMNCFVSQLALQDYSRHILGLNNYRCYTLPATVMAVEGYYMLNGLELHNQYSVFGNTRQTAALKDLQTELSRVYNSRSWRLTMPLRWLSKQLKFMR
jgi:LmbE family N-acetylglucosaminyl deacetylase